MAFSKEDRKKVFDFFTKILQKVEQPVYYENLRGHINKADSVVKDYVLKQCKGEELLKYFEKRKNYFIVDFRGEVSLIRNPNLLFTNSLDTQGRHESKKTAEPDNVYCSDNSDIEYFYDSRSNSFSSIHMSASSEDEDYSNQVDDMIEESIYYEKETLSYFCDLLRKKKKLNLNAIDIKLLPNDVKYYIRRHLQSLTILFFKDNPHIFHIDDEDFISLVNIPLSAESFQEIHPKKDTSNTEMKEESFAQLEETESVINYLQCAEFFAGLLKKRSLPLKHLSGGLSQAPQNVLEYLNANYQTFKHFLIEADKLFTVKDHEISITKNGFKLLKRARKLASYKSNAEFTSQSIKSVLHSLFQNEKPTDKSNSPFKEENTSCSDTCILGLPAVGNDENVSQLLEDEKLNDEMDEKLKASESFTEQLPGENAFTENSISHEASLENVTKNDDDKPIEILSNEDMLLENSTYDNEARESLQSVECLFDKMKRNAQRNFIECTFTAQLLCLEVHEKCYNLRLKYEHEAVKHFVDILEKLSGRTCDLNSLKGSLGQASSETNFFMKQLYKGEKINSFFVEHKEFIVSSPCFLVKLSPTYKDSLEERKKLHRAFVAGEKMYDIHKLYDFDLHETFADVIDCLSKICCFLQNKSKTKLSRLNGMSSKFSASQLVFINSLDGSLIAEKLKQFLHYFTFFDISDEYVEISQNLDILSFVSCISRFNEKLNVVKKCDKSKLPCFDYLVDYSMTYEDEKFSLNFNDFKDSVIDRVKSFISYVPPCLDYSDLPNIVGYEAILAVLLERKDSRILMQLLEESGLFKLENGRVFLKDSEEDKLCKNVNESGEIITSQNFNDESTVINVEDLKSTIPVSNSFRESDLSKNDENKLGSEVCNTSNIDVENEKIDVNTFCESASCESDKATSLPHSNLKDVESYKKEIESVNDIADEQKSSNNCHSDNLTSQIFHDSNIKNSQCAMFKKHNETMSDKLFGKSSVSDAGSGEFVINNLPSSQLTVLEKSDCKNEVKFEQKSQNDFNESDIILKSYSANVLENTSEVEYSETPSVHSFSYMDKVKQISEVAEENHETSALRRNTCENSDIQDIGYESNFFKLHQPKHFEINSSCDEYEKSLFMSSEEQHTVIDEQDLCSFKNDFNQYEDSYNVKTFTAENVVNGDSEGKENKDADFDRAIDNGSQSSALSKNVYSVCSNESVENSRFQKDVKKLVKGSVYHENISKENVVNSLIDKNMNPVVDETSNASNNKVSICPEKVLNVTEDYGLTESVTFGFNKCNSEIEQKKMSKTDEKDFSPCNHSISESRKNSNVNNENVSSHNFSPLFLQPLLAKVILLTFDSCIVETIVNGCKKYLFCLKSSFYCDKHTNCSDCFDVLTVGDEVSCYTPPAEKFQCGNMGFSFMFCIDSKLESTESMQPEVYFKSQPYIKELSNGRYDHALTNNKCNKHMDSIHVKSQVVECNTEVKLCSRVIEKEQKNSSTVSQDTQTVNSSQNVYFGVEKGCQVKYASVSQDTQTLYKTLNKECQTKMENKTCHLVSDKASLTECPMLSQSTQTLSTTASTECQTDINIKLCPPVCDKSSMTNYSTMSTSTQTVSKLFENDCQTDISGRIKSCCDTCDAFCQTEYSRHVQDHISFKDEYCQTLLVDSETHSAVAESDAAPKMKSHFVSNASTTLIVDPSPFSPCSFPERESCSTACQTISTGAIWIKNYYM